MKTILGKPLLEYQIERLKRVSLADELVVATTTNDTDTPVVELCKRLDTTCYRGPEEDVLARFHGAAHAHGADAVIRVTADCPIIDPRVVDKIVQFYADHQGTCDYVSNSLVRSYPRGMDTEVFSLRTLDEAFCEAREKPQREHVTPFIYSHPGRYRVASVMSPVDLSSHRWTVDTGEDFELIRLIIEALYPYKAEFGLEDVIALLRAHPEWVLINSHVEQKKLEE
jgi:spore coat polysaccharide biosynthesis protein SpsF